MMNKHLKSFLLRGMLFGGFGPVIGGIVYAILDVSIEGFSLSGLQVFLAILSTYLLAFLQAGASVFNQIEEWPLPKSVLCHFAVIYFAYVSCYLVNTWIPFKIEVILLFTALFAVVYLIIWLTVLAITWGVSKKMNRKLHR